jgi:hypothetical protein
MQAREYILAKQVQWAMNRGLKLIGSKGERGRPLYTDKLDDNLFQPLDNEVRLSFSRGDGNEIKGSLDSPAKMQALHSSSALSVNVFQYWKQIDQVPAIAAACGFCRRDNKSPERIVFEDKYVIDDSLLGNPPNIDLVIYNAESAVVKRYAIECSSRKPIHRAAMEDLSLNISTWPTFGEIFRIFTHWLNPSVQKITVSIIFTLPN